jgi:S-adenosylmethionine:tRNA ribosyltransferase-isomerase
LVGGLRSWKEEELIEKRGGISLVVRIQQKLEGFVSIEFTWTGAEKSFSEILKVFGNLPIPPYLNRATQASDWQQYQTVYSRAEGSVAAPTAGLHFTPRVFNRLKMAGIKEAKVILHVGAGTFQPVKSERLEGHRMHAEYIEFDADFVKQLLVQSPKPIIAVGTTSLRTIESMYWMGLKAAAFPEANLEFLEVNQWEPYDLDLPILSAEQSLQHLLRWMEHHQCVDIVCRTRILIAPPYQLKLAGGIITNFHQPQSTLLLLISAIVGAQWRDIYDYALTHQFRFLSYGDSSLLLK